MTACAYCGADPDEPRGDAWTWLIEKEASSLNARVFNAGARRWEYARERDEWVEWFKLAIANHKVLRATCRRRLIITRLYGSRQRPFDYANFVGGCKPLVDAMVLTGLLLNDALGALEDHYRQERHERELGVRIYLEDLSPPR